MSSFSSAQVRWDALTFPQCNFDRSSQQQYLLCFDWVCSRIPKWCTAGSCMYITNVLLKFIPVTREIILNCLTMIAIFYWPSSYFWQITTLLHLQVCSTIPRFHKQLAGKRTFVRFKNSTINYCVIPKTGTTNLLRKFSIMIECECIDKIGRQNEHVFMINSNRQVIYCET